MYRLRADRTGRPHIDREMSYRNSGIPKPSQVDAGSAATPTIPPGSLVAITDNADPVDAVVYRTTDAAAPPSAPRRLPGAGVRQERKRQRELTDRLRPLTERREQLRLPGPRSAPTQVRSHGPASRGWTSTGRVARAG